MTGPSPRSRTCVRALATTMVLALVAGCSSGSTTVDDIADGGEATGTSAPTAATTSTLEAYGDYESVSYDDPARWVCHPDADDICDADLDATAVAADGTRTVEPFEAADDAPVDCFYVYPTISRDPTPASDWEIAEDQEEFVTLNQAARLQRECRLFAPVYRQVTAAALAGAPEDGGDPPDPYADVVDAFRTYLAADNRGRGFVLVGHSQGSVWLLQLLKQEIEPRPELRELLVGAYLAGSQVRVPEGELVGGDLTEIPLCSGTGETGCVTSWSSWDAGGGPTGGRASPLGVPACVHPGTAAGTGPDLDPYFTAATEGVLGPGTDGEGGGAWVEGADGTIETPFVRVPGLVRATCTEGTGADHLAVTLAADPADPRTDDLPAYSARGADLHLLDVSLAMGTVVASVGAQADAYTQAGTGN